MSEVANSPRMHMNDNPQALSDNSNAVRIESQSKRRLFFGKVSVENAEMIENCPRRMMILF